MAESLHMSNLFILFAAAFIRIYMHSFSVLLSIIVSKDGELIFFLPDNRINLGYVLIKISTYLFLFYVWWDRYEELFIHYYVDILLDKRTPTTQEVFEQWMEERKETNSANYLTQVHNRADWNYYFAGRKVTEKEKAAGKIQFKPAIFLKWPITKVKISDIVRHYKYLISDENITKSAFMNGCYDFAPFSISSWRFSMHCIAQFWSMMTSLSASKMALKSFATWSYSL